MPTIAEEPEGTLPDVDFSQLLDLSETAFDASNNTTAANALGLNSLNDICPAHGRDNCLCQGHTDDWEVPEPVVDPILGLEEPDYSKLENWIPRFIRPEKPCDYCRSRRLNCYLGRGEVHCTPCLSLFRDCSLTNSRTLEANNSGNGAFLDTLHAVDEDAAKEQGTLTGIKPLASKGRGGVTSTPVRPDDAPGSTKRNGIRFPRHAVKILRDWLDAHADHPYPSEEEKADLERQTELKSSQIANWLANARRRRKVSEKARPRLCMSPSLRPTTAAIAIPRNTDKPWDELNPFERWKNSPPENEPASITDIAHAVATTDIPEDQTSRSPSSGRRHRSSNGSGFSSHGPQSTTSLETSAQSSSLSSAAKSRGSSQSHGSFGSFSSGLAGKRDRKRRRQPAATVHKASEDKKRIFQCTFCTDTFKSKYDWTRHEKSLHLSLEKWICAPLGPVVSDSTAITGNKKCTYCDIPNPSDDHVEGHNHRQCEEKGLDARTFYRKDHLRQHLRLMHGCEMSSSMESWKSIAVNINSRCGLCAQRFTVWQERVDHLTAHFKAGARMSEWKGCRGLDPAVAVQVTNAMPPYLIGIESVSPNPFSATNRGTWRQAPQRRDTESVSNVEKLTSGDLGGRASSELDESGFGSRATCWEILTVRLGAYANEMAQKGVVLSDEMLQQQARHIIYDSDDTWNQTAADNPEWLDLFKKAHGLDFIPNAIGGQGLEVPEDLETYGDLGLRIPFAIQLQAYNLSHHSKQIANESNSNVPGPAQEALQRRRRELRNIYLQLSKAGVLHEESFTCPHMDCRENVVDISPVDDNNAPGPRHRRWCSYSLSPEKARQMALTFESAMDLNPLGPSLRSGPQDLTSHRNVFVNEGVQSSRAQNARTVDAQSRQDGEWDTELAAAKVRAQGLSRLTAAEYNHCTFEESNAKEEAARSRARALAALTRDDTSLSCDCVAPEPGSRMYYTPRYELELPQDRTQRLMTAAAQSRARALAALTRDDAPLAGCDCDTPEVGSRKCYTQRHKLELPQDRARRFATTTGAWEDSGMMPEPVPTSSVDPQQVQNTTTGAMMEFLGGEVGGSLLFSNDLATSNIPLQGSGDLDWDFGATAPMNDAEMMRDLDDLIAATAAPQPQSGHPAVDQFTTATPPIDTSWMNTDETLQPASDFPADLVMDDLVMDDFNFNDMTYDGVFDMSLDDTFGVGSNL